MPDRPAVRVSLSRSPVIGALALIAVVASSGIDAPHTSEVAGATREPAIVNRPAAQASLKETLQAAVILVDAGLMVAPGPSIDWPAVQRLHEAWLRRAPRTVVATQRAAASTSSPRPEMASSQSGARAPLAAPDTFPDAAYTRGVWDEVNVLRAQAGLVPVTVEARLERAATGYASLMAAANWFSHTGPDGSSFIDRLAAAGFPFDTQVGEVLALAPDGSDPQELARAWMDSPAHRAQILGPYSRAGLGCAWSVDGAGARIVRCAMEFAS